MRLLLKITFPLTLLFAACIGLIRAQPYDDSELRAFLTPPDGCPMPCFMGIRPGVTTREEALTRLQAHDWTTRIVINYVNRIVFHWSGLQPGIIEENEFGYLAMQGDTVNAIYIPLNTPFANTVLAFGLPNWTGGLLLYTNSGRAWQHRTSYTQLGLNVISLIPCPVHENDFWNAPASISLTAPSVEEDSVSFGLTPYFHSLTGSIDC